MPNGGSDCCGTCCFNTKKSWLAIKTSNKYAYCKIRELKIEDPFWTYCVNHPHHNTGKLELPLGPVYISDGYPYTRKVWVAAPDNEQIRLQLLAFLSKIDNIPQFKYPVPIDIEEEVLKHIGVLKEKRALPDLRRLVELNIENYNQSTEPYIRNKIIIVGMAIEVLMEISDGEALNNINHFINIGLPINNYEPEKDHFAILRYHLVRAMKFADREKGKKLLAIAINDPHPEVKAFAYELLQHLNK